MKNYSSFLILTFLFFSFSCSKKPVEPIVADLVIHNGTIYDGSGDKPFIGSVGIKDDKIIYVGQNTNFVSDTTIDATGLSVSPGFINMLSWGYGTLMNDGRGLSQHLRNYVFSLHLEILFL